MSTKRLLASLAVLLASALGTLRANGDGPKAVVAPASQGSADVFYGGYHQSVPIEAPAFHGIEPKLAISYDAGAGNGFLGVGWNLAGISVIERVSPGRGTPRYDGTDGFTLDGNELVACPGASVSPSCTTGGTHATKIESYQRILFSAQANTWTVTATNGTRSTYTPIYGTPAGTFRWGLASVVDLHGNTVTYTWSAYGGDAYPTSVSYGASWIGLYNEGRPDLMTFSNGNGLGTTQLRLKTVDVIVAGARARAYKLTYTTSVGTSRSLLTSVQQFGRDATFDGTNTVTGGTALPAWTFSTAGGPATTINPTDWGVGWGDVSDSSLSFVPATYATDADGLAHDAFNYVLSGDFNGDGKDDVAMTRPGWNGWRMRLSAAGGGFTSAWWATGPDWLSLDAYNFVRAGDFDGDGKTDIAWTRPGWNGWQVRLAKAGGGLATTVWYTAADQLNADAYNYFVSGDFNGDKKTDIAWTRPGWNGWQVRLSQAGGGFQSTYWATTADYLSVDKYNIVRSGDFNGDGKTDIATTRPGWNGWWMRLSQADTVGFVSVWWATDADGLGLDSSTTTCNPVQQQVVVTSTLSQAPGPCPVGGCAQWPAHMTSSGNQISFGGNILNPSTSGNNGTITISGGTVTGAVNGAYSFNASGNTIAFGDRFGNNVGTLVVNGATVSGSWSSAYGIGSFTTTGNSITFQDGHASGTVTFGPGTVQNCTTNTVDASNYVLTGDFNGDGKADIATTRPGWNGWRMRLSQASGSGFVSTWWATTGHLIGWDPDNDFVAGDFNGDGKTDIAMTHPGRWDWWMEITRPYGGFTSSDWGTPFIGPISPSEYQYDATLSGDFNGDGKTDIVVSHPGSSSLSVYPTTPLGGGDSSNPWLSADVDGDGRTDFVKQFYWPADGHASYPHFHVIIARSNGDGTFAAWGYGNAWGPIPGAWQAADVNGDGKADLVLPHWRAPDAHAPYEHFHCLVAIGHGDGNFDAAEAWSGWGNVGSVNFKVADVNGDGLADIVLPHWRAADAHAGYDHFHALIALSQGSGQFSWTDYANTWGSGVGSSDWQVADTNGDGKADLILPHWRVPDAHASYEHFHALVAVGHGDGSFATFDYGNGWGNVKSSSWQVADVNGDGKSDLVLPHWRMPDAHATYEHFHALVALSEGDGQFDPREPAIAWGNVHSVNWHVLDMNNDGRADVVLPHWRAPDAHAAYDHFHELIGLSLGEGGFSPADYGNGWGNVGSAWRTADLNGDGYEELGMPHVRAPDGDASYDHVHILGAYASSASDLTTVFGTGLGGTTTVAYAPSSTWQNANNPPIVPTVRSITANDGRGGQATTTYAYEGGLFDRLGRRFLGFHYGVRTSPAGNREETWFHQDYGSVSKPQQVNTSGSNGVLLKLSAFDYATNGATVPYTSLLADRWDYTYDGSGTACAAWPCANAKRGMHTYGYTPYGAIAADVNYGDFDVGGDEKTTQTLYAPNTAAYVVDRPAVIQRFDGTQATGTLLEQTLVQYDGASAWTTPPVRGDATAQLRWLNTTQAYVASAEEYDGYGNVTAKVDEDRRRTTFAIDPTYHLYVTQTVNANNQATQIAFDPVCGVVTQVTDANSQSTQMTFDNLCRLSSTTLPGGGFEHRFYVGFGSATTQLIQVEGPSADGTTNQWRQTYFDGLGRAWQTSAKGPTPQRTILTATAFDADTGLPSQSTDPFYAGDAPVWSATAYDALGRVTQVQHADGKARRVAYGAWSMTTWDELQQPRVEASDAYGHTTRRSELHNGAWLTTSFAYDARGNPASIVDPVGNTWSFAVDSLGRKVVVNDPDAGTTTYEYDAAGLVTASTDGNGQRTQLTYDALGRVLTKTTRAGTGLAETVSWTYDEARSGYANIGQVTTARDARGTGTFSYDGAGRQTAITRTIDGSTFTLLRSYDGGGRLLASTYPEGTLSYVYDGAGRALAIPGFVNQATYTAAGALAAQVNANGTATTRTVDAARGWVDAIATASHGTSVQSVTYGRDATGRILSVASPFPGEAWSYAYDDLGRLTSATNLSDATKTQTFQYDVVGNLTYNSAIGSYTYPGPTRTRPHAVLNAGGIPYSYDAAGNLVLGAGRSIAYNGDNRPSQIDGTAIYYDADGNRVAKIARANTTQYLGDDYEVTNGVATRYVSLDGFVVAKRTQGAIQWLHADASGAVQVVTDASGAVLERDHTTPYRDALPSDGPGAGGATQAEESGLQYMHSRYYDAFLGRFLSPDPSPDPSRLAGLNEYAYASDDPIDRVDPSGSDDLSSNPFYVPADGAVPKGWVQTEAGPAEPGSRAALAEQANLFANAAQYVNSPGDPSGAYAQRLFDEAVGYGYRCCAGLSSFGFQTGFAAQPQAGFAFGGFGGSSNFGGYDNSFFNAGLNWSNQEAALGALSASLYFQLQTPSFSNGLGSGTRPSPSPPPPPPPPKPPSPAPLVAQAPSVSLPPLILTTLMIHGGPGVTVTAPPGRVAAGTAELSTKGASAFAGRGQLPPPPSGSGSLTARPALGRPPLTASTHYDATSLRGAYPPYLGGAKQSPSNMLRQWFAGLIDRANAEYQQYLAQEHQMQAAALQQQLADPNRKMAVSYNGMIYPPGTDLNGTGGRKPMTQAQYQKSVEMKVDGFMREMRTFLDETNRASHWAGRAQGYYEGSESSHVVAAQLSYQMAARQIRALEGMGVDPKAIIELRNRLAMANQIEAAGLANFMAETDKIREFCFYAPVIPIAMYAAPGLLARAGINPAVAGSAKVMLGLGSATVMTNVGGRAAIDSWINDKPFIDSLSEHALNEGTSGLIQNFKLSAIPLVPGLLGRAVQLLGASRYAGAVYVGGNFGIAGFFTASIGKGLYDDRAAVMSELNLALEAKDDAGLRAHATNAAFAALDYGTNTLFAAAMGFEAYKTARQIATAPAVPPPVLESLPSPDAMRPATGKQVLDTLGDLPPADRAAAMGEILGVSPDHPAFNGSVTYKGEALTFQLAMDLAYNAALDNPNLLFSTAANIRGSNSTELVLADRAGLLPTDTIVANGRAAYGEESVVGSRAGAAGDTSLPMQLVGDSNLALIESGGRGWIPEVGAERTALLNTGRAEAPPGSLLDTTSRPLLALENARATVWATLDTTMRNLLNDPFPVVWGINPARANAVLTSLGATGTDVGLLGGANWADIRSVWAPSSQLDFVRATIAGVSGLPSLPDIRDIGELSYSRFERGVPPPPVDWPTNVARFDAAMEKLANTHNQLVAALAGGGRDTVILGGSYAGTVTAINLNGRSLVITPFNSNMWVLFRDLQMGQPPQRYAIPGGSVQPVDLNDPARPSTYARSEQMGMAIEISKADSGVDQIYGRVIAVRDAPVGSTYRQLIDVEIHDPNNNGAVTGTMTVGANRVIATTGIGESRTFAPGIVNGDPGALIRSAEDVLTSPGDRFAPYSGRSVAIIGYGPTNGWVADSFNNAPNPPRKVVWLGRAENWAQNIAGLIEGNGRLAALADLPFFTNAGTGTMRLDMVDITRVTVGNQLVINYTDAASVTHQVSVDQIITGMGQTSNLLTAAPGGGFEGIFATLNGDLTVSATYGTTPLVSSNGTSSVGVGFKVDGRDIYVIGSAAFSTARNTAPFSNTTASAFTGSIVGFGNSIFIHPDSRIPVSFDTQLHLLRDWIEHMNAR